MCNKKESCDNIKRLCGTRAWVAEDVKKLNRSLRDSIKAPPVWGKLDTFNLHFQIKNH